MAGRTTPEIEREIENKLANRAVEPQVVINITEQNSSIVTVVGDTIRGVTNSKFRALASAFWTWFLGWVGLNIRAMTPV